MRGVRVGEASNPGPVTTLATQVDSSGIEQERARPMEGRDVRPRSGHRRGLVVEIAPNVVDATQEPESAAEGCPSEQQSLEDNESEQAAEEEDVECGEPIQDILFVPERRSMDMVERVFEVGRWS